jgi:hypothetical protein
MARSLQEATQMNATDALACVRWYLEDFPNPFRIEYGVALFELVLVYGIWSRIRPTPMPGLRALVLAAAASCAGVMLWILVGGYDEDEVKSALAYVMGASFVVTVALLVELICNAPSPISRAVARWRRHKTRSAGDERVRLAMPATAPGGYHREMANGEGESGGGMTSARCARHARTDDDESLSE